LVLTIGIDQMIIASIPKDLVISKTSDDYVIAGASA